MLHSNKKIQSFIVIAEITGVNIVIHFGANSALRRAI